MNLLSVTDFFTELLWTASSIWQVQSCSEYTRSKSWSFRMLALLSIAFVLFVCPSVWLMRPTGTGHWWYWAFDENTRLQGRQQLFLPAALFMADQISRRSGSRSSVGFRVHTFPAGLL